MKSLLGPQEGHLKAIGLHPLKQLKHKITIRAAKAMGTKKPQRETTMFLILEPLTKSTNHHVQGRVSYTLGLDLPS